MISENSTYIMKPFSPIKTLEISDNLKYSDKPQHRLISQTSPTYFGPYTHKESAGEKNGRKFVCHVLYCTFEYINISEHIHTRRDTGQHTTYNSLPCSWRVELFRFFGRSH